jgi:hypothetical protein
MSNIRRRLHDGGVLVTMRAVDIVMKKHNLQPDKDGNIQFTFDMIAEAEALDRATGEPEIVIDPTPTN